MWEGKSAFLSTTFHSNGFRSHIDFSPFSFFFGVHHLDVFFTFLSRPAHPSSRVGNLHFFLLTVFDLNVFTSHSAASEICQSSHHRSSLRTFCLCPRALLLRSKIHCERRGQHSEFMLLALWSVWRRCLACGTRASEHETTRKKFVALRCASNFIYTTSDRQQQWRQGNPRRLFFCLTGSASKTGFITLHSNLHCNDHGDIFSRTPSALVSPYHQPTIPS